MAVVAGQVHLLLFLGKDMENASEFSSKTLEYTYKEVVCVLCTSGFSLKVYHANLLGPNQTASHLNTK